MSGNQIDQQETADEITAGEYRYWNITYTPEDEERAEVFLLHRPDAKIHLVERRDKDQDDREHEQNHRQPERHEEIAELTDGVVHRVAGVGVLMVLSKA